MSAIQYWLGPTFSNPVQLITRNKWFVITSDQIPELKVAKFLELDFALRIMAEYCLLALENYHGPGVVQLFRELPLHEVFSNRSGMEAIILGYQEDPHSSLLRWLKMLDPHSCPLCNLRQITEKYFLEEDLCSIHGGKR